MDMHSIHLNQGPLHNLVLFLLICISGISTLALAENAPHYQLRNTLLYSTRQNNGRDLHTDIDIEQLQANRLLSQFHHYELHDFEPFFNARRQQNQYRRHLDGEERMSFDALGRTVDVTFKPFDDLFGANYRHQLIDEDGREVASEPALDCIHRAQGVQDDLRGSIALCRENELLATFFGNSHDEAFSIEPVFLAAPNGNQHRGRHLHVVYAHDDVLEDILRMGRPVDPPPLTDTAPPTIQPPATTEVNGLKALRNSVMMNSIATTYTDASTKYAGVMQINDNGFYKLNEDSVQLKAAQVIAGAKVYYDGIRMNATYRVILELAGMITMVKSDPWVQPKTATGGLDDNALLGVITTWKQKQKIEADIVHFLVGTPFTQAAGWGFIGTACGPSNTGETEGTLSVGSMAAIAAHEMGHVLGMQHDDVIVPTFGTDCSANPGRMGRRRLSQSGFSECSIEWLRLKFNPNSTTYNTAWYPACMETRDYALINETTVICGDGIISGSEQCDCPNKNCTNVDPCCDGATCRLKTGATCSPMSASCCDPKTCKSPLPAGTLCRAARHDCDLAEKCTGTSVTCPEDSRRDLGETCVTDVLRQQGTCTCDGCKSLTTYCLAKSPTYSACSFKSSGDAACGSNWCSTGGAGCTTWYDAAPVGQACGDRMACNANQLCVPIENVVCPWSKTKSPTPPTTQSPTGSLPTFLPTKSPTKAPQPYCGNGVVDVGEDCDCGMNCATDSCCNDLTCKYKTGAVCSAQDLCCNTGTCQIASAGTVCRAAKDSCDMNETCDGRSRTCPRDQRQPLGTACTTPTFGLAGKCNCDGCTSIDDRCKQRNSAYSACGFTPTCGAQYCNTGGSGCTGWGEAVALGYSCGTNMGCSNGACVDLANIMCTWMNTPAPTSRAPTTRRPTTKPPTKRKKRRG